MIVAVGVPAGLPLGQGWRSRSATGQGPQLVAAQSADSAFHAPAVAAHTAAASAAATGRVTPVITGIATAVEGVLDAAINCLSSCPWPDSTEFVQGAFILVRRTLFPVSTSVGLDYGTAFASLAPDRHRSAESHVRAGRDSHPHVRHPPCLR